MAKKKKAAKGRGKGAHFEREVCKQLSGWMTNGARDDLFWRTAMSGGRATLGARGGNTRAAQLGDVCAIDPLGVPLTRDYVMECKFRASIDLDLFIMLRGGILTGFWEKVTQEAASVRKQALLIAKQNRREAVVIMPTVSFLQLFPRMKPACADVRVLAVSIVYFDDLLKYGRPPT